MTTPGGSGFSSGEDFVAARVSLDIPSEGIQSLKELSGVFNNYRTVVEAAARGSGTFVDYLNKMQQAAQVTTEALRQQAVQLERNADLQQRAMGGSAQAALPLSRSAPQGYVDPWAGMGSGMGGQRTPPPGGVQEQIQQQAVDPVRQLDPQRYVNAQAGRYRTAGAVPTTSTGAPDWNAYADRVEARDREQRQQGELSTGATRMGGLAQNISNEIAPGGRSGAFGTGGGRPGAGVKAGTTGAETAQAAADGDEAGSHSGGMGSALGGALGSFGQGAMGGMGKLGGLLKGAGPIGAAIAAGVAGLGALQKGGSMYQDYKNTGLIRGEGAGQGLKDEALVRSMALNPFISTDQARQMVMAGLSEGYSGKQFDTVTQFMSSNLKNMNVEVADSVKMLRQSIQGGATPEQGAQQWSSTLGTLKQLSKPGMGVSSLPDLIKSTESTTQSLIGAGVPSGQAQKDALYASQMWNTPETRGMKGDFGQYVAAGVSSPGAEAGLAMLSGSAVPGLMPEAYALYEGDKGVNQSELTDKELKKICLMAANRMGPQARVKGTKPYYNAIVMTKHFMQAFLPGSPAATDINKTKQVYDSYVTSGVDYGSKAKQQVEQATGGAEDSGDGGLSVANPFRVFQDMGHAFSSAVSGMGQKFTGADNAASPAPQGMNSQIAGQFGGGTQIVDGSGGVQAYTGSQAQQQGLSNGSLNWKRQGEQGSYGLPQGSPQAHQTGAGGTSQTNVNFSPAAVELRFTNGGVTASPNPVQLTPNQQAVNAGHGGASMNNAPPGDGYGYYSGRMGNWKAQ